MSGIKFAHIASIKTYLYGTPYMTTRWFLLSNSTSLRPLCRSSCGRLSGASGLFRIAQEYAVSEEFGPISLSPTNSKL